MKEAASDAGAEALAQVVDRAPRRLRAQPSASSASRSTSAPARMRGRQRLERPRLGLADPLDTPPAAVLPAFFASTSARSAGIAARLGQRALEVTLR